MNEQELICLLQDLYDHAKDKLDDRGHGCTYYFHELQPELYDRLSKVIKVSRDKP